jgi:hypothetical protein
MQRLPVAVSIFTVLFFIFSLTGNMLVADPSFTNVAFADDKGDKKNKNKEKNALKGNKRLRSAVADLQGRVGDLETAPAVPGPQGEQGEPGSRGEQGIQGEQGPQGNPGLASTVPGPRGEQGIPGPQGEQGPPGEDGANGLRGADSTVAGPIGPQGPPGSAGAGGATQYALSDCADLQCGRAPQVIGNVHTLHSPKGVGVSVPISGDNGSEYLISLNFLSAGSLGGSVNTPSTGLYYASDDFNCSGQPYGFNQNFKSNTWLAHNLFIGKDITNLSLYVQVPSSSAMNIAPGSYLRTDGQGCQFWGGQGDLLPLVPIELVHSDFYQAFPPPYSLDFIGDTAASSGN